MKEAIRNECKMPKPEYTDVFDKSKKNGRKNGKSKTKNKKIPKK